MAFFTWSEDYSINVHEIDEQHKKLIAMLNELFEAMSVQKGSEILEKTLSGMIAYTKTHFSAEERWMRTYNYPDYAVHKKAHDALARKVMEIEKNFRSGKLVLSVQVGNFLKDWLTNHILSADKKFGKFLETKGIKMI